MMHNQGRSFYNPSIKGLSPMPSGETQWQRGFSPIGQRPELGTRDKGLLSEVLERKASKLSPNVFPEGDQECFWLIQKNSSCLGNRFQPQGADSMPSGI